MRQAHAARRPPLYVRTCVHCGAAFPAWSMVKRYCGRRCVWHAWAARQSPEARRQKRAREKGQAWWPAYRRRRKKRTCRGENLRKRRVAHARAERLVGAEGLRLATALLTALGGDIALAQKALWAATRRGGDPP